MALSSSVFGQNVLLPKSLSVEEQEFNDALRKVRLDCTDTVLLEEFIVHHPSSKYVSAALLELERAQILSTGTYSYVFPDPLLSQFKPSEQPYQIFYENQRELSGSKPDFSELRGKYELLLDQMSDPGYMNEANYYLGYIDYVEGKYKDALNRFNSLPADTKYSKTVPFYKLQILYADGKYEETLALINNTSFSSLSPDQKNEITRIKAECLLQSGKKAESYAFFKNYVEELDNLDIKNNLSGASAYNCAVLAYESGDYKLAQKALSKAINNDEELNQYCYMLLGQTYLLTNETPKAKMAFQQASSISANKEIQECAAYNEAVLVHETSYSPWGDEVTLFEDFLNKFPNSKYSDNVSTYLTEVYLTTKNYDSALSSIRKIKQPNQTILDAKQRLLYQRGIQEYVNGDYVSSNNHFTECLDVKTSDNTLKAPAYYWRGESRYHLDFLPEALDDYNNALALTSDKELKSLSNYSLGYVLYKKQQFSDAARCFEYYIANPDNIGTETYYDAVARLGDCAYYSRDFVKAESYYSTVATAECKSSPYGLYQQAFMLGLQKKYTQKQNILDRLIALYPNNDYIDLAWLEKGNTSILQGEDNAAINSFKYIVDNYPDAPIAPQAAVQLAMAYNNTGQTAQAQKIYEMVAKKYPNTDEAITAIQDLKTISTNALYEEMPVALANGNYNKVIENYNRLVQENVDFRDLQKMQLMTAKACFGLGNNTDGMELLAACASDVRTEAGSEAKYMIAQKLYDGGDFDKSLEVATEFIQNGTSYQYWLARTIILMSDISLKNGDDFTAKEYLKSLQSNYEGNDDIKSLITSRLSNLK